MYFIFNFACF